MMYSNLLLTLCISTTYLWFIFDSVVLFTKRHDEHIERPLL